VQITTHVRHLMEAATHVLAARTRLWHVLGEWGELMDLMYATRCFGESAGTRSLVERLEMDLEELAEEVEGITVRADVYVCVILCMHICVSVCVMNRESGMQC
jgi:hypothetical protein